MDTKADKDVEKQKQDKLKLRGKKEKPRGGMRGAICKRVSANAPPAALSFPCLFGCLCWDVCLSAAGAARRTCIKTSTRPIVTPKTSPYFSVLFRKRWQKNCTASYGKIKRYV